MTRRECREHLMIMLYQREFYAKEELPEQIELYLQEITSPKQGDLDYIQEKYKKTIECLEEIDDMIEGVSEGWKLKRMAKVDLTIMRLAVYEMKYDEEIPVSVAINEAVEIAKKYGQDSSPSFINGILAKIAYMIEKG
ncbi:MAG: transcription antitermination factor NusB [Lachnospiraceae bacterium]|nr:transcription antitermination factor NusB [Lachnospiraceae bacterium]